MYFQSIEPLYIKNEIINNFPDELLNYQTFVKEKLVDGKVPATDPIKWNGLAMMRTKQRIPSVGKNNVSVLRNDAQIFSRLYIGSQSRGCDLEDFFLTKISRAHRLQV